MSMQHSWRNGLASAVHAAGNGFESLLVPIPAHLPVPAAAVYVVFSFNSFFSSKAPSRKRTLEFIVRL